MCGITGIFAYHESAPPVNQDELLRMREYMLKRGPDSAGLWISENRRIGLASRRLAIIDLSDAGAQPMATTDGRFRITFNGEIYNYRELKNDLEANGCVFRSHSDTEALLHLYTVYGADMVQRLRGMFAFAIWDEREKTLFLARDHFGIKPLYYADDGQALRFASQVKALIAGGSVDTAPESAGAVGFLLWGCVPDPFTLYRGIQALPAGSHLIVKTGVPVRLTTWFSVREELEHAQEQARPFRIQDREALAGLLRNSVRHHLISDAPVGMFLSAGMDSSLITALASELEGESLCTHTLGFEEYRGTTYDEVPLAEQTASVHGTQHSTHWIRRTDFEGELEGILAAMDQPTTDGVNIYLICREASRAGLKVALTGLGGDELFGGYPSFRDVPRIAHLPNPFRVVPYAGQLVRRVAAPLLTAFTSPKYAGLIEYSGSFAGAYLLRRALFMPWEITAQLDPVAAHTGLKRLQTLPLIADSIRSLHTPHAKVSALELAWYMRNQLLRDTDWAGMAHSIEVRVPYIDVTLFRALAPWLVSNATPTKVDAAAAPRMPLNEKILNRPKSGFSVPVREWLDAAGSSEKKSNRGLRGWARRVLPRQPKQFRALVLVTDAFGGYGGIAKFNRDLITSLAAMPACAEVIAVPRLVPVPLDPVPQRVKFLTVAAGGKIRYTFSVIREALSGPFNLVVTGHINLTAFGAITARMRCARSLLIIHGIDAWTPHGSQLARMCLPRMDYIIGVSNVTLERFGKWAHVNPSRFRLLPNCVDIQRFTPGPKPTDLARQLRLLDRTVIMTLGRLASEERYKGFDEVIEALPALARNIPNISYLICGDGPDRARLEEKARSLGVQDRIVFAGLITESRKVDYYRLADAYVMPSRGEGFGIVILEALACGLPAMGSTVDGTREALLDGALGELVDPANAGQVVTGIMKTLTRRKCVPDRLMEYTASAFNKRASEIMDEVLTCQ